MTSPAGTLLVYRSLPCRSPASDEAAITPATADLTDVPHTYVPTRGEHRARCEAMNGAGIVGDTTVD
jgi:hypothetical protein